MTWEAVIEGDVPSKANNYKIGKKRLYKDPDIKEYEKDFCRQVTGTPPQIDFPYHIELNFFVSNSRKDVDNCCKTVSDCLEYAKIIKNDNLCYSMYARKFIDKKNPRVYIKISPLQNNQ